MKILALAPLLLFLSACSEPDRVELSDEDFTRMAEGLPVPAPENEDAEAVNVAEKDELVDFAFSYPAEAAAIAKLKIELDEKMEKARTEIRAMAADEAKWRKEEGLAFAGLYSKSAYSMLGSSERLLSLLGEIETYTGGAHGNRGTVAILWDRVSERSVDAAVLFGDADGRDAALGKEFCAELEQQRRQRIGEVLDDSMFASCPDLDAVTILPVDADGDGRFETVRLIADPYVAGAYAEGDYRVDLAMTPARIAAVAEPYGAAFGQ